MTKVANGYLNREYEDVSPHETAVGSGTDLTDVHTELTNIQRATERSEALGESERKCLYAKH